MVGRVVTIPAPPEPFNPLAHAVSAETLLHRVHSTGRSVLDFNASSRSRTRFAPVVDRAGGIVPTLYCAATAESAVCESILHDVPLDGGNVPLANYETRKESTFIASRTLTLAAFLGDGLRKLNVTPQELTATDADVYDDTVEWSIAAYNHEAKYDGIAWMSARRNTDAAYMLFGDRVAQTEIVETADGIGPFAQHHPGFDWLSAYCARLDIELLSR